MHLIQPWLLAASVAALPRNDQFASASLSSLFARDDFDAGDLSFIGKLLAIGDSYSAGIGAGDRLGSVDGEKGPCRNDISPFSPRLTLARLGVQPI